MRTGEGWLGLIFFGLAMLIGFMLLAEVEQGISADGLAILFVGGGLGVGLVLIYERLSELVELQRPGENPGPSAQAEHDLQLRETRRRVQAEAERDLQIREAIRRRRMHEEWARAVRARLRAGAKRCGRGLRAAWAWLRKLPRRIDGLLLRASGEQSDESRILHQFLRGVVIGVLISIVLLCALWLVV